MSAFVPLRGLIDHLGYYRALNDNFQRSLDRLRWLVPSESIDEFVDLWAVEVRRDVPNRSARINVAPESGRETAEARAAILARPELYAYDDPSPGTS